MARMHSRFAVMHPELADRFSQQQLRDYVAYLRRIGFVVPSCQAVPDMRAITTEPVRGAERDAPHYESTTLVFRQNLTTIVLPKQRELDRANSLLLDALPDDCDLWQVNCAVYEAASDLVTPRNLTQISGSRQITKRMSQLNGKIRLTWKLASRVQCVIDYLTSGRSFTAKVKKFAQQLRTYYHTLNKLKLLNIKQRLADKIRVMADAKKRLQRREEGIRQNSIFWTNPSNLFKHRIAASSEFPSMAAVEEFWGNIYEKTSRLNADTPGIVIFTVLCDEVTQQSEDCPPVSALEVKNAITGARNFSSPGWDGINNYWWKKFTSVHQHLARIFTSYINGDQPIPHWLVEGRTTLIPKSGDLSDPRNHRPITCLNTLYKLFTNILNERIEKSVKPVWQRIVEQRGCKMGVSGCKDNLLIDRCVCQDAVQYKRNLSIAWLDYMKAYDSTSHEL
ncbi:hypothetical protein, partial [Enterobacter cloacae complex sp. 4DZ3-17B2]|uniref:hypothetical protein n=1 Tax=Enterobacter cloacae complex sp. 4DZ3-17B2 TaxID=2511990 RepID=UPI0013EB4C25